MDAEAENPLAVIGGNNPPVPTPYDESHAEITDLFSEARHFLDGEPVETQDMADAIGRLMTSTRKAIARADERRKAENRPFDEGKAEVQTRYNVLIGETKAVKGLAVLTIETCKQALAPFLEKQRIEKQAIADAARAEAEERTRIAQDAIRASQADLAARQRAERLVEDAKAAERAATKAEKDRPAVHGGGRAITGRTRYTAVLCDPVEALKHARAQWAADLKDWLAARAQQDVNAGKRSIPGFMIEEQRSVI